MDIAQRKAETTISAERQLLELVKDTIGIGFWRLDLKSGATEWDDQCRRICEAPSHRPAPSVAEFTRWIHPEDIARLRAGVEALLGRPLPQIVREQFRLLGPSGTLDKTVTAVFAINADEAGRPGEVVGLLRELAELEQERLQSALLQSERRFRKLYDSNVVGVFLCDPEGHIFEANDEYLRILGHTRADLQAQRIDWQALTPPEYRHLDRAALESMRRTGRHVPFEKEYQRPDGQRVPVLINRIYLGEAPERIFGMAVDLTEKKAAERKVRAGERRWKAIVDALPEIVYTMHPDGTVEYLNQRWRDLTDTDVADGEWVLSAVIDDDLREVLAKRATALRSGTPFSAELRLRCRGESQPRWFVTRAAPVRDETGQIERWVGISTDIDVLKRAEARLREADRLKDEFLATLAHELRNPMAPIRYAAELLHAEAPGERVEHARRVIERQASHLSRLLDDLLDVSRITRNAVTLRRMSLDLREVVHEAVEMARPACDAAGHRLQVQVPASEIMVEGDRARLVQVFGNLLDNACKYTAPGGRLSIALQDGSGHAVVRVADNGIGMQPDMLTRAFELFTQADDPAIGARNGLGVGLAVVKRLVELHDGTVEAHSDGPSSGSEFIVRLPILAAAASAAVAAAREVDFLAPSNGLRVLLVDDNRDAADTLQMLLAARDVQARAVYDGASALQQVDAFRPHAVILDLGLPDIDGAEVARQIRALCVDDPLVLIAVTGRGMPVDRETTRAAGFDRHLVKPVDPAELMAALKSAAP